jgi:hypothetical protein
MLIILFLIMLIVVDQKDGINAMIGFAECMVMQISLSW